MTPSGSGYAQREHRRSQKQIFKYYQQYRLREGRGILTRRGEELVALIPAEDVHLLEAMENQIDLEDARAALKEAEKKGTIPLEILKKEIDH